MENGLTRVPEFEEGSPLDQSTMPTFFDTYNASMSYKYGPAADYFEGISQFGWSPLNTEIEEGYVPRDNIPDDLKGFGMTLLRAQNQQHMDSLVGQIRKGQKVRQTLYNSGVLSQFAVELGDPVNYIGLPIARGGRYAANFLKGGASVGAVVAAQELIRAPLDPVGTTSETAINLGAGFILGGTLTSLSRIPAVRKADAIRKGELEIERLQKAIVPDEKTTVPLTPEAVEPDGSIAKNIFTDSFLYKAIPTAMKNVIANDTVPNSVKLTALKIANDSGILLAANKAGQKIENSTYQNAKLFEGEWVRHYDEIMKIWGESTGKGVAEGMDYMLPAHRKDFESWFESVDRKMILGIKASDDFESGVMNVMDRFYSNWEKRLNEQGLIGSKQHYIKFVKDREQRIVDTNKKIEFFEKRSMNANEKFNTISGLKSHVMRVQAELDEARLNLEGFADEVLPPNEKIFRPRYWDIEAINKNREAFEAILVKWYTDNPSIITMGRDKKPKRVQLQTDEASIKKRANESIDTILGIKDIADPEIAYYGAGKSKHFKHRGIDIPNELVLDFMITNPVSVMKAYVGRVGPRYEFARQFNGKSIDDILDDTFSEMMSSGNTVIEAHAAMKNIRHLYQAVTGGLMRNPDRFDAQFVKVLRDLAQLNFLGRAYQTALAEPSKIIMEHGLGPTMKGLFSILKDSQLKMGAKEIRIAGEALENIKNMGMQRISDDLNNNPFKSDLLDKAKQPFYMLNGLGPITRILKDFDGMMRSHSLIDYSVRWTQGKATKMEQEYLLRYNIDLEDAKRIANAPWQKSESGMYIANTDAWTNSIEFPSTTADIVSGPTKSFTASKRYRPAFYRASDNKIFIDEAHIVDVMYPLRGWENPRVEGVTPLEKGIITSPEDYVAFIKMHEIMHSLNSAKSLGFDKRTKAGNASYENAINDLAVAEFKKQARVDPETVKTFRSALSGGVMNTILMGTPADKPIIEAGIAYIPMRVAKQFGMKEDSQFKGYARIESALLGLPFQFFSYSFAALNKTTAAFAHNQLKSRFTGTAAALGLGYMVLQIKTPDWVDMSFQDQLARSFDYSGVAALYSDMFYTAMTTSLALGGPNLTGGLLEPRFPQEADGLDAVTSIAGAGPSIAVNFARGAQDLINGKIGEGTGEIVKNLPFMGLTGIRTLVHEMQDMLEGADSNNDLGSISFGRY